MSSPIITSAHVAIHTLEHLSRSIGRAAAQNPKMSFTSLTPQKSGTYALGGLGTRTAGISQPAPFAPGSFVRMELKAGTSMASSSTMHPAVAFGFENPCVRFGGRTKTSSRPKSAEGATSFHFSHSYQSKTSPIQQMIREFQGGRKYSGSQAGDHLLYIEREGAAEKMDKPNDAYAYDEFEDEFEAVEKASQRRDAITQQDYLECLGAVERIRLKNLSSDELEGLEKASFGSIGDSLQERHHFWSAVEKFEREPRGDTITLRFRENEEWWQNAIARREQAPKPLKQKLEEKMPTASRPEDIVLSKLNTKTAFEIYKWAHALSDNPLIDIEPGRGGRVQNRIIAELPFELDAIDRVNIVDNFIKVLKDEKDNPLPYWAVVHAPDENNDKRNYHVHIIYYDRPVAKMLDPKNPTAGLKWDFEITEEKVYKNYTRNINHPYAQEKFREANGNEWILKLRAQWEQSCNKVMQEIGLEKRYDRRTYKEMGIDLDPLKHIPSKTFNKERKGELTEEGVVLARRQWDNVKDTIVSVNATRTQARRQKVDKKVKRAEAALLKENPFKDIASREIKRLAKLADTLARRVGIAELYQDLGRVVIDRTASRARLVFHAAIDKRGKKKKGRPPKNPSAQALNGATKPLGKDAIEARDFLHALLPYGKSLDQRKQMEVLSAQRALHTVLTRIDALYKNPKQHPLDTRQPGYLDLNRMDLDPPAQLKKKAELIERVQASLNSYADKVAIPAIKAKMEKARDAEAKTPAPSDKGENVPSSLPLKSGVTAAAMPAVAAPIPPAAPIVAPPEAKPEPGKSRYSTPSRARFRFEPFPKPERRTNTQSNAKPGATQPAPVQASPVGAKAPAGAPTPAPALSPKAPAAVPARPIPAEPTLRSDTKANVVPPMSGSGKATPVAAPSQPPAKAPDTSVAKPIAPAPGPMTASSPAQSQDKPAAVTPTPPSPAAPKPDPMKEVRPPIDARAPSPQASSPKPAPAEKAQPATPAKPAPQGSVTVPPVPASDLKRVITGMVITKKDAPGSAEKPRPTAEAKPTIIVGKPVSPLPKIDGITITMPSGSAGAPDKKKDKDVPKAPAFGQVPQPEVKPPLPPGPRKPKKPKKRPWRPDRGPER